MSAILSARERELQVRARWRRRCAVARWRPRAGVWRCAACVIAAGTSLRVLAFSTAVSPRHRHTPQKQALARARDADLRQANAELEERGKLLYKTKVAIEQLQAELTAARKEEQAIRDEAQRVRLWLPAGVVVAVVGVGCGSVHLHDTCT